MTIFFRFSRLAAAVVLAAFMAVWTLHPWTTGDTSPFATVNDAEGLAITVADGSATPTGAIFRFENSTDGEWQFGQEFWIEKKENGEWREIRSLRSRAFDALSYLLAPHSVREEVYSLFDQRRIPAGQGAFAGAFRRLGITVCCCRICSKIIDLTISVTAIFKQIECF